ncbi:hypothetical protein QN372_19710 [Undibacterium sp. RTI2.1]|uniref:hypothetical protein n=1 Tax=unclassified Undibacterium TaxID=2630295 RepID=UPI002B2399D0|nr:MULTISPECIES: hypothetical protein [unclassified Undibacterium]MEB0032979.1 hypothetical protein [Undibacterium sp. RTI2.1]MEB0118848.1 hypothetical protein [Undibacterium sp. RTI2.2]
MRKFNTHRLYWMLNCRWTIKEIKSAFQVPRAIAQHIQDVGLQYQNKIELEQASTVILGIVVAHNELTMEQHGF